MEVETEDRILQWLLSADVTESIEFQINLVES